MTLSVNGSSGITFPNASAQSKAAGLTTRFTSANQALTSAGALTIAHGLGAVPGLINARLICLTAEAGYTPGQIISVGFTAMTAGAGITIVYDATNIIVRYTSAANCFSCANATTGVATSLTNANWALILDAFL